MSSHDLILTEAEEQEVIAAITEAENHTSGEIRVHLEKHCTIAPMERAIAVFDQLEMYNTQNRTGVLIYVATEDHKFAICGDKGINEVVPAGFWESTMETMRDNFKQDNFKEGLIEGILKAGSELKKYFPCCDDDKDELTNDISRG